MKLHVLKIEDNYYQEVRKERKKAELRKDDRDYKVGDLIHFTDTSGDEFQDNFNLYLITHILPCRSLFESKVDYVVISITPYFASPKDGRF